MCQLTWLPTASLCLYISDCSSKASDMKLQICPNNVNTFGIQYVFLWQWYTYLILYKKTATLCLQHLAVTIYAQYRLKNRFHCMHYTQCLYACDNRISLYSLHWWVALAYHISSVCTLSISCTFFFICIDIVYFVNIYKCLCNVAYT